MAALILSVCVFRLVICGWIPAAMKLKGYSSKLYLLALAALVSSVFLPGLMYWCMADFGDISLVVNGTAAMMAVMAGLACHFLPTIIAFIEKRSNRGWMLFLNCMILLPFSWESCLVWACAAENKEANLPSSDSDSASPAGATFLESTDSAAVDEPVQPAQTVEVCVPSLVAEADIQTEAVEDASAQGASVSGDAAEPQQG